MSVTDVAGFAAAGIHCGIKQGDGAQGNGGSGLLGSGPLDLAVVRSDVKAGGGESGRGKGGADRTGGGKNGGDDNGGDKGYASTSPSNEQSGSADSAAIWQPLAAAGVFTSNKLTAAPVVVSRQHLAARGSVTAVVLNSGNANAATGSQGMTDAERMCELTAQELGCDTEEVLVCSTGLIGFNLPMDAIESGIPKAVAACVPDGGPAAAEAIMTTDTVIKQALVEASGFRVGGMAKGAAMLQPDMATMLAVLTTDAAASVDMLQQALSEAVKTTFNCLTTDGAQSTNDTVLLLASARAEPPDNQEQLTEAVREVCASLALQMADDAEGSTKTVTLHVTGAAAAEEAATVARRCANSQLVKCSWYGCDPYWGRIASECGVSGVAFDADTLTIAYGDHVVYRHGEPQQLLASDPSEDTSAAKALRDYMQGRQLLVRIDLGQGEGEATVVTTDLTPGYIAENMRTS